MAKENKRKLWLRALVVLLIFVFFGVFSTGYGLINTIFVNGEKYSRLAEQQQLQDIVTKAKRGNIYDKNMNVLATSATVWQIFVAPANMKDEVKDSVAENLANLLNQKKCTKEKVLEKLNKSTNYETIGQPVEQDTANKIREYISKEKLGSVIGLTETNERYYPNGNLASTVLGFVGTDNQGLGGVEAQYDNTLTGTAGRVIAAKTPAGAELPFSYEKVIDAKEGDSVVLTIDEYIQSVVEKYLQENVEQNRVNNRAACIVMDVNSGEILAMATKPDFDPNDPLEITLKSRVKKEIKKKKESNGGTITDKEKAEIESAVMQEQWRNKAVSDIYEPGSVFKIFTVGIAYDQHGISPNDSFLCDGVYEKKLSSGERIRIKCLEHHGWCTPRDALRFSCNDALGQIADRIYDDDFIARIRQLGFGTKTGVELPGETAGVVKDPDSKTWSARSKPTIAIGQEITVSALQMVQAASAIANGGVPVQLTFIHKITNKDGTTFYEHTPEYKSRILSCMETTATTGTGARANLRDVSIGVKTGTAQMADKVHGGYSTTDFLSNCISIFPIEDPQIVLYIVVTKAKGETYAGRIVAPVIAEAADVIIDHLGMSRESAASLEHSGVINIRQTQGVQLGSYVPDFTGKSKKDLIPLMSRKDIHFIINGSGWVTSQNPPAGTPLSKDMVIELNLE